MINIEGKQIKLQIWDTVSAICCAAASADLSLLGWPGSLQVHHQILLPGSGWGLAGVRHHQAGHLQPPDHLAGGRQAAQQQQHGHHAHREQKVGLPVVSHRAVTFIVLVIWRPGETSRERRGRPSLENTASSLWKLQQRLPLTWRRHLSTPPGRSTTRSRRGCSTSTMRPTASRSVLSIVLLGELREGQEGREARLGDVVNSQAGGGPWRNNISLS